MATICFFCIFCGTRLEAESEASHDLMECHSCTRHVPVPKLASLHGNHPEYPPVLPPEILDLSLEFECHSCGVRLRADARWEGRAANCPKCTAQTIIPRWSTGFKWTRKPASGRLAPMPVLAGPVDLDMARLSREEIEFLSASSTGNRGAAV
jgi:hypothetical protein